LGFITVHPCLSQVCSLGGPLEKDLADYAAGKCQAVEIWLTKLEAYLQSHSIQQFLDLVERHGVSLPVASYQGGLLSAPGPARDEAWALWGRRLQLCRQIGIATLVVAADMVPPVGRTEIDQARSSLAQMAREAGQHGMRIALEFQARAAFCNNLQTAAALVAEVASPQLGLCLDVFHYYVGPSKLEDLACVTADNLFHVQLSDLVDVPRELARDADRILPGEGDLPLGPIIQHLRRVGYEGHVSIELMNPQIWRIPALQFGEIAMTSLRKILQHASMA
jgi:2-keto-myo-inositol isomerase